MSMRMLKELRSGGRGGSLRDTETNRITAQWTLASASASPRRARSCVAAAPRIEPDEDVNSSNDEVDPDEIDAAGMGETRDFGVEGFRLIDIGQLRTFINENFCCRCCAHGQLDDFVAFVTRKSRGRGMAVQNDLRQYKQQTEQHTATVAATKEDRDAFASTIDFCCTEGHDMKLHTSPTFVNPTTNREVFEVNIRMVHGVINIGRGRQALYMLSAHLNMPLGNSWWNNKAWRRYENIIGRVMEAEARKSTVDALQL